MSRLLSVLIALALVALSCSGSSPDQATPAAVSADERASSSVVADSSADETASEAGGTDEAAEASDEPATDRSDDEQVESETEATAEAAVETSPTLLLPDPDRWVVVDDWSDRGGQADEFENLDVAPLNGDGVPQLGRRIALSYRLGSVEELERQWGDASSMGEPVDFEIDGAVGRSVRNEEVGFAMAVVWHRGTFVTMQTQDPDTDLAEFAMSVSEVDDATWTEARAAVGTRMGYRQDHLDCRATRAVCSIHPSQSPAMPTGPAPGEYQSWHFGFADTAEEAAREFVPQVTISAVVFDEDPGHLHPINYPTISALGLDGVIYPVGGAGITVRLGTGTVQVNLRTRNLDEAGVREFLDVAEFATTDPLDGFVLNDQRFQPVELSEWRGQPPSWHAAWKQNGRPDASISVWRLSVPELRVWLLRSRGHGLRVPDDVWETVAARGGIDFGRRTTYDVDAGLLMTLSGIERDSLIPIEIDDWIALVEPVNTDPIRPR
ncbi:hypothetical protein GQR58_030648 [Nymphon striatum]|nr:hypothetical protein GQR58_030648 [Nymphon striatum]